MNAALRSHAASFGAAPGAAGKWANLAFCCAARMRPFDDRRGAVRASWLALRCAPERPAGCFGRTAARILSAKSGSAQRIAGWRSLPAPGSIPAGRAFRLPWLVNAWPMGRLRPHARKKKAKRLISHDSLRQQKTSPKGGLDCARKTEVLGTEVLGAHANRLGCVTCCLFPHAAKRCWIRPWQGASRLEAW